MIQSGSTEAAYRKWLNTLGPLETAYQEMKAQKIIQLARALDLAPEDGRAKQGLVELRSRLLRNIRWASKDLRDAIAENKITNSVEVGQ